MNPMERGPINQVLDVGVKAIISDGAMMIVTCLIANYLTNKSPSVNTVTFIVSVYCVPYLIYTW